MATFSPTKICGSAAGQPHLAERLPAGGVQRPGQLGQVGRGGGQAGRGGEHDREEAEQEHHGQDRLLPPAERTPRSSGPSAIFGTALTATSSGVNIRSSAAGGGQRQPDQHPGDRRRAAKPSSVSSVVSPACSQQLGRPRSNAASTSRGGGSTTGWTSCSTDVTSHQAPSATSSPRTAAAPRAAAAPGTARRAPGSGRPRRRRCRPTVRSGRRSSCPPLLGRPRAGEATAGAPHRQPAGAPPWRVGTVRPSAPGRSR